jgi:hypothetical protein
MSPAARHLNRGLLAVAVLAGVLAVTSADHGIVTDHDPAAPAYSEDPVTGEFRTTEPIGRKEHLAPRPPDGLEAWYFCFDHLDGGWTCVPVSAADFRRYRVGEHVTLRQRIGELAQLTPGKRPVDGA